jgi:hypothetical protein
MKNIPPASLVNVAFGVLAVGAGLTGKYTLFGVGPPWALSVAGALGIGLGVWQIMRARS